MIIKNSFYNNIETALLYNGKDMVQDNQIVNYDKGINKYNNTIVKKNDMAILSAVSVKEWRNVMAMKDTVAKKRKISVRLTEDIYWEMKADTEKYHTDTSNYIAMLIHQNHQNPVNKIYTKQVRSALNDISAFVLDMKGQLLAKYPEDQELIKPFITRAEKGVEDLWRSLL